MDVVTTAALMTQSERPGVSVELNVSYLGPAPVGVREACSCCLKRVEWTCGVPPHPAALSLSQAEVLIDARVLKVGKALATLVCDLRIKDTGRLVAQGRHTTHLPGTEFAFPTREGQELVRITSSL